MKKYLPILLLSFLTLGLEAQNPCPTCHQGTKGLMIDSLLDSTSLKSPRHTGNGNSSLGQSYVLQNVCGLNYTQSSVLTETRSAIYAFNANGTGFPTTMTLGGLPCGGNSNILQAYLYYEASYTEASPPATSATITNPVPATATYAATMIGQAGPKCWGETGCATYRANVTAAISGNGAYKITLNGFSNPGWEVDGCTLIVIYKNPAATYSGSISLWDGCIVQYYLQGPMTYSGINVCATTGTASAFGVFGDMQINVNGGLNTETFNGTTATFPNIFWNWDAINTSATAGQTSVVFNPYTNNGGDCYSWSLAGFYWQNTTCQVCTPATTMTLTTTQVNPSCGGNNGSATVTVAGGNAPYTYLWNPGGQTTATATGLSAGTYTCTVTDAGGCSTATTVVTLVGSALTVNATITQNVLCNGNCNGIATSTIVGGTAPFTYSWTPTGGTNATATGLCPGTYTITVHDHSGCTGTATVTITQPPVLTATVSQTNDKCNGGATGTATVTPAGGTAPYTYLWAPGGQTNATATGLTAGSYTVTVTDNHGCQIQEIYTITQPPPMIITVLGITNVNCNGSATGSISVSVSGGANPYTYLWTPSGGTGANATGLSAGTYTLTVTDNNGCSQTVSETITEPTPVTANANVTSNILCNGGKGSAQVTAGGGTPGYTYVWTPVGGTNQSVGNLSAGTYTVVVTDSKGCTATATVTLTQPPVVTATISGSTNVLCSGGNNATATVTAGGGTPGYTYLWSPSNQTNATATGLSAGTYTVTVTDANGCTATTTVIIIQPSPVTATITASTGVSCNGGANGSATVVGGGGTPGYTYSWNPGGNTNATATGLSAGTYTVTVKDANGCTGTTTVTITQPTPVTATITATVNDLCNGGANGSATVTAGGGTPGYSYNWTPIGGTGSTGTGLTAGTYTVTVTDSKGCTATTTVTITEPTPVTATITATTNVSCNGQNNGSATVTAGGGTPGYKYSWSPSGGTASTATGLSANTYTVTVTDANGCIGTTTVTITQPPVLTVTATFTQASCNLPNGTATATVGGGTPGYTYIWTPGGGTNSTATGLSIGTYTVVVTDANGCTAAATTTVTQPSAVTASITGSTPVSCNGGADGTATVTAVGGTTPYTYLWNPGGNTNSTATGLSAGNYTVTVTDNNGCISTASVTITQPTPVTANITTIVNDLCNGGNNGSATVTAGGGTPGYTYNWNPNGGTGATGTGLTAGTYTVTVTDANGCTATAPVIITEPTPVTATISATTDVSCNGLSDGSATVTAGGGTPGYTYNWTPSGGTNATASNLSANTYTVTVTDANGCTVTTSVTITQPPVLTATTSFTQATCNLANGTATVNSVGGTNPYTYLWSPGGNTNSTATGLLAGNYTVVVTDNHGCTTTATVTVTQPSVVAATMTGSTGVSCFGGADGTATVSAAGGSLPYTYLWNPGGNTNATATGLSAGNYTVTVTDNNGCISTATVTITQPTLLTATISASTNVLCNGGNNGSATVTAGGGTPGYTYLWAPPGGTNATQGGLTAGTYTVTITDANGCTASTTVTITEPPVLTANITATTNVSCFGGSNGSSTVTVAGGTTPYTYLWTPAGGINPTGTGLTAGSYTVTVTDNNGCIATAGVTITQPPVLTASITASTNVLCNGGSNGTATVTAVGGTLPYTYLWNPSGGNGATGTGMAAGYYVVTVTDNNGCTATASVTITEPPLLTISITGVTNVSCNGGNNGTATSLAGGGTPGYTYSWAPIGGTGATGTGLSAGTYTVTVTDANGCTASISVNIVQPLAMTVTTAISSNVSCNGGNNGAANATPTGGTNPYTYVWSPIGGTNAMGTGLSAGTYTVTVTDINGCTGTATATITQPTVLGVTITGTTGVLCNGASDGSATASGNGGTAPYGYAWSPSGGTNATGTGMSAGVYTVTVTDANGCTASVTATITQPLVLTATTTTTNVSCFGGNNGTATATPAGGTGPYKYAWSPSGGTNATGTGMSAGSYTVTVTDVNGCTTTASVTLTSPTRLKATASGPQSVCSGAQATLIAGATGGTAPYTYSWSPSGGTTATTTTFPVSTTVYTVTVTDNNGCTATASVKVITDAPLALLFAGRTAVCPGGTINLTATGTGGDGLYNYLWLPSGQTTQSITFSPKNDTVVTIELTDGCGSTMLTETVPITIDPLPKISFSTDIHQGCIPLCLQFRNLTTIPSGGIAEWGWSFGNGDSSKLETPVYCYKDTGVFSVSLTATSDSGCSSTLKAVNLIKVYPPPTANFTYSPQPINILSPEVQFTDLSTGKYPISQWIWGFGQGDSVSYLRNPSHFYPDTGTYCATLVVVDMHGCVDSITNCFVVNPVFTLYIPDAFSPNGDGINDVFMAKGSYVKTFEMYIFDRWGMQLFHSTDMNNGWTGVVKNGSTICQEDTYVYLINVTDSQGNDHSYTGKVNLIK